MTTMSMGANIALAAATVRAVLVWDPTSRVDVDASALLLTDTGKVRSDDDFIFYNQPQHERSPVRYLGKAAGADALEIGLGGVEPAIERIVIAASADGGTFGQVPGLAVRLLDVATGAELAVFAMSASAETAFVAGELYRRNGQWKFRAIGQGYASGLAGLATDFGISVAEDPEPATPPPPTGPPAWGSPPSTGAAPAWGAPAASSAPAGPAQMTPTGPNAVPTRPSPQGPVQPPPGWGPQSAAAAPAGGPPASWSSPPAAQPYYPPPAPAAQPGYPPPAGATRTLAAPANLDSGRVSLVKNQRVSLVKSGAPALSRVVMGLGWDPAPGRKNIDLDASVIAFDQQLTQLETVWFTHLKGFQGAIQHLGDNRTGRGEGDDEQIRVELAALPPAVTHLVFTINSFRGHKFTDVSRAFCRLVDDRTGTELARFDLSDSQPQTAVLMAVLSRLPSGSWEMRALGEYHDGRTVKALVGPAEQALRR